MAILDWLRGRPGGGKSPAGTGGASAEGLDFMSADGYGREADRSEADSFVIQETGGGMGKKELGSAALANGAVHPDAAADRSVQRFGVCLHPADRSRSEKEKGASLVG